MKLKVMGLAVLAMAVVGAEASVLRVKQTEGGPRLFKDGQMIRPRFVLLNFGTGPTEVGPEWRKTELTFVAPKSLDRTHVHFRFEQPKQDGDKGYYELRNVALTRKDGKPNPTAIDGAFASAEAFKKGWSVVCNYKNAAKASVGFTNYVTNGVWHTDLVHTSDAVRPPDYILVSRFMPIEKGVEYTFSYEVRSDFATTILPTLYYQTPVGSGYINIPMGSEPAGMATVKKAARVGVNEVVYSPMPHWFEGGDDFEWSDTLTDAIVRENPKAQLIARISCDAPSWWMKAHKEECMVDEFGNTIWKPAPASRVYRDFVLARIKRFIAHMMERYPNNFGGIQPAGQATCEWFYEQSQYKMSGYDKSTKAAYRKWLKDNGRPGWETAEVPTPAERKRKDLGSVFIDPKAQANVLDFNRFLNENLADWLAEMFAVCRKETKGEKLVFGFYGYVFNFLCNGPTPAQSGHYALQYLLDRSAADLDIICAPISYINRGWVGTSMMMGAPETVERYGVMWFDEQDARTYLAKSSMAQGGPGLCLQTKQKTLDVLARDTTREILRNYGCWWMDLMGYGWWNDDDLWEVIAKTEHMEQAVMLRKQPFTPEVALIVDEESVMHMGANTVAETGVLGHFPRVASLSGIPYGQYLLSDVMRNGLKAKFQVYVATWQKEKELRAKFAAEKPTGTTRLYVELPYSPNYSDEIKIERNGSDINISCPVKKLIPTYDPKVLDHFRPEQFYDLMAMSSVHRYVNREQIGKAVVWASDGWVSVQALEDVELKLNLRNGEVKTLAMRQGQCKVVRE